MRFSIMIHLGLIAALVGLSCGQIIPPIFPPGNAPGDVIDSVDNEKINDALQDLVSAIGFFDGKGVALALANTVGGRLINPRYYVDNGEIYSHVPAVIEKEHTGLMLFTRKFFSLTASEGVLTYEIEGTDYNVAILWSNPFNEIFYERAWNAKIYPKNEMPDRAMFRQMYEISDYMVTNGWYTRNEYGVNMLGSMTDNNKAKLTVFVDSSAFSIQLGPDYNAWCSGFLGLGKRCERECSPLGKCSTEAQCGNDNDCEGNDLVCSRECS